MRRRVALRRVRFVIGSQVLTAGTGLAAPTPAAKPAPLAEHLATEMLSVQRLYEKLTATVAQSRMDISCSRAAKNSALGKPEIASVG